MDEDNTPQGLGRTESIIRDGVWKAAYLAQLTDALAASVGAFAKKRAGWVEGKSKRKDHLLWRELLNDALNDTWTGDVTWDPTKAPLDLHLKRVIRSRTSMMMKHLTRFPRVSANAPRLDLEREMSEAMAVERASEQAVDLRRYVDGVIGTLLMLAAGDELVVKILSCFAEGLVDRREILRHTGMSQTEYHNARRRMLAFVERLPQNLREEAIHAMA